MFDIGSTELLLIVIVAVLVIGPKELPRALYKVGQVVNKARGMARHFRTGIDAMVREVELEELEKKWSEQNRRIMKENPAAPMLPPERDHDFAAYAEQPDTAANPAFPVAASAEAGAVGKEAIAESTGAASEGAPVEAASRPTDGGAA